MALQPGERFGRYELVSQLGRGGMAETYRARLLGEAGVTKPVLIKKVLPEFSTDQAFIDMFISEARISATLSHGNIAQVYDFGRVDGEYFLAMEYVDGQPLHRLMKRAVRSGLSALPVPLATFIALELCRGLHYAHTRTDSNGKPLGIVHRDISPDNVLVSYEGQVKIVDFGIAKARELRGFNTEPGVVKGKYLFFSPEQARGEEVDARTDVWATGIVLYEMLCGRLPVQAAAQHVALPKLINGEFPRPRELNPKLPETLEDIIRRALALEREERYASCHAFADALAGFLYATELRFSAMSLSHFVHHLYREELTQAGRAVQVPGSFPEQLSRWTGEVPGGTPEAPPPRTLPREKPAAPVPQASSAPSRAVLLAVAAAGAGLTCVLGLSAVALFQQEPEGSRSPGAVSPLSPVAAPPPEPAPTAKPVDREVEYRPLLQQARSHLVQRAYEKAAANYRAVLAIEPQHPEAMDGLGFALVMGSTSQAEYDEARKLLQQVVEKDPANARAWFALGMCLQVTGSNQKAAEAYRRYLALEPSGKFSADARLALKQLGR